MLFSRNGSFEPLKMRIEKVSGRRAGLGEVGRCPRREQRAMKDDQRSVRTVYNGRVWINELDTKGPYRGSFQTKEAAVAVGRAHAAAQGRLHVIQDMDGNVLETLSYIG